mgnify:CR=1 FL=1|tara:strand:+ start:526 stop:1065 length:540 start_codon:yes stop_codon:yes gene_type:complete
MMAGFAIKRVGHVGICVNELAPMVDFYSKLLGFMVSDQVINENEQIAYLTRHPREHHQLVLAVLKERSEETTSLNNVSFKVKSLTDLKDAFSCLSEEFPNSEVVAMDHGNSWSIHFKDVENNNCEIFCPTPWRVTRPYNEPLDLSDTVEEIIENSKKLAFTGAGTKPSGEWQAATKRRF